MPDPNKLRSLIKKSGKTQEKVAKEAGITRFYLSSMVNNHLNATEKTLLGLSKALGCNVEDLL